MPFRQRVVRNRLNDVEILGSQYSRARLDFFLISVGLLELVSYVKYEDRLGRDFDHKEVYTKLGGGKNVVTNNIRTDTLSSVSAEKIGTIGFYDTLNEHAQEPSEEVRRVIGLLESLNRRKDKIIEDQAEDRIVRVEEIDAEMLHLIGTLPSRLEMLERPSTCDVRAKYEVVIMSKFCKRK